MTNIINALLDLSRKRKEIQETARAQAREILAPGLKTFMEEHPEIEAIRWTQYTPYFNDGDTCEFQVNGIMYKLVGGDPEAGDFDDGFEELSAYGKPKDFDQQPWYKALMELERALYRSEEELEAAFGDHARVIVTKSGVDVEQYDHD